MTVASRFLPRPDAGAAVHLTLDGVAITAHAGTHSGSGNAVRSMPHHGSPGFCRNPVRSGAREHIKVVIMKLLIPGPVTTRPEVRAAMAQDIAPWDNDFRPVLADPLSRRLLLIALLNASPVAVTSTLFLFFVESRLRAPGLEGPLLLLFSLATPLVAGVTVFLASPVILSIGGLILTWLNWRWTFLVNVPVGLIAIVWRELPPPLPPTVEAFIGSACWNCCPRQGCLA